MPITIDMFGKPKRKSPRVMMHMIDCGVSDYVGGELCALFKCKKCGYESPWRHGFGSKTKIDRGIPCERCNQETKKD